MSPEWDGPSNHHHHHQEEPQEDRSSSSIIPSTMTVASESDQAIAASIIPLKVSTSGEDLFIDTVTPLNRSSSLKNQRRRYWTIARHAFCIFLIPLLQLLFHLEFLIWSVILSIASITIRMLSIKSRSIPFICFAQLLYSSQFFIYSGIYDLKHKHIYHDASLSALRGRDKALSRVDSESLKDHASAHLLHWETRLLAAIHEPDVTPEEISNGVSVIIAAHQEYDFIERTLESILNETASLSLTEILVIDDFSEKPLQTFLRPELSTHKRILFRRNNERMGLIKSKQLGGDMARGSFVVFLDGHVKPTPKWVPYLLREMTTNPARVVVPAIPILEKDIWDVKSAAVGYKMMFDWDLSFHWFEDNNDEVPCMSGGLLGITKEWWTKTGGYDPGMRLWGSENIEQSIKTWMSGGEIVVARKSKVSHVFRRSFPYSIDHNALAANKLRLIEVWFDDWKSRTKLSKRHRDPQVVKGLVGDLSQQQALRRRLAGNRTFDWYVRRFRNTFLRKRMIEVSAFLIAWIDDDGTQYCLVSKTNQEGGKGTYHLAFQRDCQSADDFDFEILSWYLYGDIIGRHEISIPNSVKDEDRSYSFNEVYVPASIVGNKYRPTLEYAATEMCLGPIQHPRAHHSTRNWVIESPPLTACKPLNPAVDYRDLHQWGGFAFSEDLNAALLDLEMTKGDARQQQQIQKDPMWQKETHIYWGSLCLTAHGNTTKEVEEAEEDAAPLVTIELCRDGDARQLFHIKHLELHAYTSKKL